MPATYARPELLASVDWVAENLHRSGVRVVDCRWRADGSAPELFASGHIPGAVFVDWATDLVEASDPTPLQLAGPEQFAATMSRAGIGDGMTVVLYDDAGSGYAARVWWSLLVYGCESARVLNGGLPAWRETGRPTSTAQPRLEPATFTPRADSRHRLSTVDVQALLGSGDVELVDARPPADFKGQQGGSQRLGHLPGAVNLPATLLTEPGTGRFRSPDELAHLFSSAGLSRNRRVVTYDSTGIGAAKVAFALALLGFTDVAVYDAGWAEWGARLDLPLSR